MPALRDLPHLRSLNLSCEANLYTMDYNRLELRVTDTGLAALRGLPLTQLNLHDRIRITDSGLEALRGMPLTDLDLSGCVELTDDGMDVLLDMPLRRLNLSGLEKLSPYLIEELRGRFPNAELMA